MREHRAERHAAHRVGRVDDHRFLVAAADVGLPFDRQTVMRAQVDVLGTIRGDDRAVCGRSSSSTNGRPAACAASDAVVNTAPTFASRHWYSISTGEASGSTSTAPRPSLAASAVVLRRRGQEDRGAFTAQRAHERRAALEQREPGGDESCGCASNGRRRQRRCARRQRRERGGEQGERIAHVRGRPCESVRSRSVATTPSTARRRPPWCRLDEATIAIAAVCSCTTAPTCSALDAFISADDASASISPPAPRPRRAARRRRRRCGPPRCAPRRSRGRSGSAPRRKRG